MKKILFLLLVTMSSYGQTLQNPKFGNTTTNTLSFPSGNGNGKIELLPIANNIAGTYNQPFYQSDFGYNIFRPNGTNLASRFYVIPNGTPSGATAKWEMFNTDYYADAVSYAGLNIFTENMNNRINIGSNRGSGGGTRMDLLIYGDYIGSNSGAQNANSIQLKSDNSTLLNQWAGSIGFGTDTPDQFGLGVANQYTFKNPTATSTRVNIVGNGTTAGLYFGRNAIRTTAIENLLTTSDLGISLNSTNTGTTLTKYATIFGATGNLLLQNAGTHSDGGYRLDVNGTTRLQSTVTLGTAPTTSAGTYDFLTRNTSTGVVEKVLSSTLATTSNAILTTTNQTKVGSLTLQDVTDSDFKIILDAGAVSDKAVFTNNQGTAFFKISDQGAGQGSFRAGTASANIYGRQSGPLELGASIPFIVPDATASGHAINKGQVDALFLSGSSVLDFPSTASNAQSSLTFTLTGAVVGDVITLGSPVPATGCMYYAYVSAVDTVTVRFINLSGVSVDPASATFKVKILK